MAGELSSGVKYWAPDGHIMAQTVSSPTLQKVNAKHGSMSGDEEISWAQELLVQFGSTDAIDTVLENECILNCVLLRSVSPGIVSVTLLHRQDRSWIPNDREIKFTRVRK